MSWLANQTPATGRKGAALAAATPGAHSRADATHLRVLSMYAAPPAGEVVLEDFERFAIARLRGAPPRSPEAQACAWCPRSFTLTSALTYHV
jgi:hypothetical protein